MKYFFLIALFIVSLLNAQNHDVWVYNSITNQHVQGDWRSPYWRIIDINGQMMFFPHFIVLGICPLNT